MHESEPITAKTAGNSKQRRCFFRAARRELKDFCGENITSGCKFHGRTAKTAGAAVREGAVRQSRRAPRGSRNRSAQAIQHALDGEAQALTRKAVELALEGNTTALKLCLDRLLAPRRDRTVPLELPPIEGAGGLAGTMAAIVAATGNGEISSTEAGRWARLVDIFLKALDAHDFEQRLAALEKRTARAY